MSRTAKTTTWRRRCSCGATIAPPPAICKRCGGVTPETRFWARVKKTPTCWLWQGYTTEEGYGRLRFRGRLRRAHQVAWELTHGPVPQGLEVCHNCPDGDNRACVNPDHLWLGAHRANMLDAQAKGRTPRGERNGAAKLTPDQVLSIRAQYAQGGVSCAALATAFGISGRQVNTIVLGRGWAHLEAKAAQVQGEAI